MYRLPVHAPPPIKARISRVEYAGSIANVSGRADDMNSHDEEGAIRLLRRCCSPVSTARAVARSLIYLGQVVCAN